MAKTVIVVVVILSTDNLNLSISETVDEVKISLLLLSNCVGIFSCGLYVQNTAINCIEISEQNVS